MPRNCRGFAMIEVLVTILLLLIGLLGLAGLQGKMFLVGRDAMQRSQALWLLEDMYGRIQANRADASHYVTEGALGVGTSTAFNPADCTTLTGYQLDLCQWNLLLQGSAETQGGNIGAMEGARGCIYSLGTSPTAVRIVVAWQGSSATADALAGLTTGSGCGSGAFGDNSYRRALFADLIIPPLS